MQTVSRPDQAATAPDTARADASPTVEVPPVTPGKHQVVIIGGGFGGLYAAQQLGRADVEVTLIDKRNFHLFQPLLYQVATGGLSPGDIASPLRGILSAQKNTRVLMGEVTNVDPGPQVVSLNDGRVVSYDSLIVATGMSHFYFGRDDWAEVAPGLKTVEDALEMRRRIFAAFEKAENTTDPELRQTLLTFVIVGGGPTGVELAGALAELAFHTLPNDFRHIDTTDSRILLIEGMDRVLPPFPPELSTRANTDLEKMGVEVLTQSLVTDISGHQITLKQGDEVTTLQAGTVLWAAGVRDPGMGGILAESTGAERDRSGRVIVNNDLSLPTHPNIFVVGDLAHFAHQGDRPLPGVAPVAMQEGKYVAKLIQKQLKNETLPPFEYKDTGSLAVIGRHAAVVNLPWAKLTGFFAWFVWLFVHIFYLIEFDNKLMVMTQWVANYLTRKQGSRLITEKVFEKGEARAPATPG
ncbi:NAD(P)/FAD-dependent oxidoreductase [Phormidium tenue]|uniref:NADH:ubiquinone reductase (non-electrogenic) n=1 Tax=Phormidium tenue NIES-30 TaxID=549789 RepID=A0A1U7JBN9_9CYAN|nr:NAD(P)/FAD-dependent oxidoreductase [Phormidium tenue]MBD2229997.1 NAD(P)/FAD-dependent oxidoreductase [Phormidium tenue FACHB-1052]OKH51153.1 FAD-dependent oxidoreductase [Phormidium tenue NIES-30]